METKLSLLYFFLLYYKYYKLQDTEEPVPGVWDFNIKKILRDESGLHNNLGPFNSIYLTNTKTRDPDTVSRVKFSIQALIKQESEFLK